MGSFDVCNVRVNPAQLSLDWLPVTTSQTLSWFSLPPGLLGYVAFSSPITQSPHGWHGGVRQLLSASS